MDLHIPLDLESRTQFKTLEGRVGKGNALAAVVVLFRVLGYEARDGIGRMGELASVDLLHRELEGMCNVPDLTCPGGLLEPAGEGKYFCRMFAQSNGHLASDYISMQRKGGLARSAKLKQREASAAAVLQSRILQPELFMNLTTEGGAPITEEDRNRVLMVIQLFDNVLGRRARVKAEFEEGLLLEAHRVASGHTDEEISAVAQRLLSQRSELNNPPRTEDVLRSFEEYLDASLMAA